MFEEKIKKRILTPLAISFSIMLFLFLAATHYIQSWNIDRETWTELYGIEQIFSKKLEDDALLMKSLIDSLEKDKDLQKAWLQKDRKILLKTVLSRFKDMKKRYRITHFNFIDPERIVFLRVQNPEYYADYIMSSVMDNTIRFRMTASGIELGTLGNLILRVIRPWKINGKLAGYIELGEEIEYIIPELKRATSADFFFMVKKSFLSRSNWEKGLKIMGRESNWDLLKDLVVIDKTMPEVPPSLIRHLEKEHVGHEEEEHLSMISMEDRKYRGGFIPLMDAGGYEIGDIIVLKDITETAFSIKILMMVLLLVSLIIGGLLYLFFFLFIGKIEKRVIAAHDSLEAEIRKRASAEEKIRTLVELSKKTSSMISNSELFPWITKQAMEILEADGCIIRIREGDELILSSGTKEALKIMKTKRIKVGESLSGLAAKTKKPVISDNLPEDSRFLENHREEAKKFGFHSLLSVPILSGEKILGVLNIISKQKCKFKPSDIEILSSFADMAAVAIENARLFEELEKELIEHKMLEEGLKGANYEIENLLASISSILIAINPDNCIFRWNEKAEETFWISNSDAVGKPLRECDIKWDWDIIEKAISDCRGKNCQIRLDDLTFHHLSGKERILGITMNPLKSENGSSPGVLIMAADITEKRIMEMQLSQSQKLESIGQLAAGIAHEINSPMQYVSDNTHFFQNKIGRLFDVLEKYEKLIDALKTDSITEELIQEMESAMEAARLDYLKKELPDAIEQSLDGIERVIKIVQSMKEFSHPGTEEKVGTDINKAIESTVTVARNEWKYVAEMEMDFDPELPLVFCLPGELNQVILNIIINASHAIADGNGNGSSEKGTISVSTKKKDDLAEIKISDTGGGIPEEIRDKIFDPFFTTKDVGKGTGQGLAIAHSVIVEKHGGEIRFETEKEKGTTFIINIPINGNGSE